MSKELLDNIKFAIDFENMEIYHTIDGETFVYEIAIIDGRVQRACNYDAEVFLRDIADDLQVELLSD